MYENSMVGWTMKDADYDCEIGRQNIDILRKEHFYTADESYFILQESSECYCE